MTNDNAMNGHKHGKVYKRSECFHFYHVHAYKCNIVTLKWMEVWENTLGAIYYICKNLLPKY
jgi:hypothetical protein